MFKIYSTYFKSCNKGSVMTAISEHVLGNLVSNIFILSNEQLDAKSVTAYISTIRSISITFRRLDSVLKV